MLNLRSRLAVPVSLKVFVTSSMATAAIEEILPAVPGKRFTIAGVEITANSSVAAADLLDASNNVIATRSFGISAPWVLLNLTGLYEFPVSSNIRLRNNAGATVYRGQIWYFAE